MASGEEGAKSAQIAPGLTVLQDQRGQPIGHTATPPAPETRDFSLVEPTSDHTLQNARSIPLATSVDSPDEPMRPPIEDMSMSPARRSVTEDVFNDPYMPPTKRSRTSPMERASQPSPTARSSTFKSGLNRARTGTNRNEGSHRFFEYKFDDASSDSDSSLSSDDDEATIKKPQLPDLRPEEQHEDIVPAEVAGDLPPEKTGPSRSRFTIGNDFFKTKGRVSRRDGRLKISINETANSGYLAKALGQSIRNHLDIPTRDKNKKEQTRKRKDEVSEGKKSAESAYDRLPIPRLNIVIMVIGSRGDIQPFIKIGRILKQEHGHRVRIASHPTFREFVNSNDLEFFSVGGDPSELMAFMVKNPGLIPNMQTVREGEISKRRASMAEMFEGFWRACIDTTDEEDTKDEKGLLGDKEPFIADAIIANPPCMAHVHIAEKLGVPLHMMVSGLPGDEVPWSHSQHTT